MLMHKSHLRATIPIAACEGDGRSFPADDLVYKHGFRKAGQLRAAGFASGQLEVEGWDDGGTKWLL